MEYDVNVFIEKYKNLGAAEIAVQLQTEVTNLESEWKYIKKNSPSYRKLEVYKDCADTLLSYINLRKIPARKEAKDMQIFLPIFKNLVDRGQLNKIMLDQISI